MANNPYVNKVVFGSATLVDLTSDTITADKLMQGYTAHDRTGATITGLIIDGDNIEYGIIDATSSLVGVGKVGSMIIE